MVLGTLGHTFCIFLHTLGSLGRSFGRLGASLAAQAEKVAKMEPPGPEILPYFWSIFGTCYSQTVFL